MALLLSGCVWLRLLETKNQIAEFDQNFHVDSGEHFILHFHRPTLLSEDFTYLSGIEPTARQPLPNGKRNNYVFQKLNGTGDVTRAPAGDLVFELSFDNQDRLVSWDFSPVFLAIAPPAFLEASLRSLGSANIDQANQKVSADPAHLEKIADKLPPRSKVVAALGEPLEIVEKGGSLRYTYKFRLDGRAVDEDHEKNRIAVAKLYFDKQTDRLSKMSGRFAGLKLTINYRRFTKDEHEAGT
ncbi:hypothetical protein MoryE10_29240 [Methylogaea oryzae]|uniref:Uncharacterized protein n=1 Tax=Methylogaea oryzae TaxID=1295382 RepID=A0A8D4VQQ8_9GAMM|nr:hypothetical protein MoryE10_29240 [Methylogaea oryzae]